MDLGLDTTLSIWGTEPSNGASVGNGYTFGLGELTMPSSDSGSGSTSPDWLSIGGTIGKTVLDALGVTQPSTESGIATGIDPALVAAASAEPPGLMATITAPSPVLGLPWWMVAVAGFAIWKLSR